MNLQFEIMRTMFSEDRTVTLNGIMEFDGEKNANGHEVQGKTERPASLRVGTDQTILLYID